MNRILFAVVALFLGATSAWSQVRYLDEVFSSVNVQSNVVYGTNITVLPGLQGQPPAPQPLVCDIYTPAGDTETNRPLLLYFHTGNFLPVYVNGGPTGTKTDSVAVEICTRFAKMGYVVASVDYRLGWNPLAATQSERTYQLINAAYRGVQDSRTAVRFFRKSIAEQGNPYGINGNKVGLFGEGTGGYIAYASATIDGYNDIILDDAGNPISKFWYDPGNGTSIPMVIESVNGNPDATNNGYAPSGLQLCMANHTGYSSDVQFMVNLGGALGDLNWLDPNEVPMVSFQAPHDPFAPYTTGVLVVPTTNELVVEVSGAYHVHQELNGYPTGNPNNVFAAADLDDVFSLQAIANGNQGWDGLYPVRNSYNGNTPTQPYDGSPWAWWNVATVQAVDAANGTNIAATQLTLNPNMGPVEGRAYVDTIQGYTAPRLALGLGLISTTGCMDEDACNYNPIATTDNGSCTYPAPGYNCEGESLTAGVRYLSEVFEDVQVTSNVVYGTNISVLPALQGAPPAAQPLVCDIYRPAGDTETNRPLLLYFHTGNFLPIYLNGSPQGTKTDSSAVEICKRFARMGYVVASVDYRLGWNPLAGSQSERTYQLINAAYRGVQDSRTAVRFFRKSVAEQGNLYGINPNAIGMIGEGTGGYITLASATIDGYNDIILDDAGNPISKFWYDPGNGTSIPMVIEAVNGNPDATNNGYAPSGLQLCMANHVGYPSNFQFQMNMGGALGDLSWMDSGDVPMVSFQAPNDPFAPYGTGVLIVPTTNELVVEVSGALHIHQAINTALSTNNNAVFQALGLEDPISQQAESNGNQGWDGLYPVKSDWVGNSPSQPYDSSPWQWFDVATVQAVDAANGTNIAATQLTLNPDMGPTEALAYIDTIQAYTAPRMAIALGVASTGPGCTDEEACNYNPLATSNDGSCQYAQAGYDCEGNSLAVLGCTNLMACNYNPAATQNDGSCDFLTTTLPIGAGNTWLVGLTLTGTPNAPLAGGCEASGFVNPNISVQGVVLGNGTGGALTLSNVTDPSGFLGALALLADNAPISICGNNIIIQDPSTGAYIYTAQSNGVWKTPIPVNSAGQRLWIAPISSFQLGCGDPAACNYTGACHLNVNCQYPPQYYNCSGTCVNDTDGDGVCNELEVVGCQNPAANNYNPAATDAGFCAFNGCTDATAQNFNPTANVDNGSCSYLVTFRVNMSDQTVAAAGVHVAGSFQGWNPSSTPLTLVGYGVYQIVVQLQAGTYEYKYINGNTWGADESVGACGNGGNRVLEVTGNTVTQGSCFGSCDLCEGCANPMFTEYSPFNQGSDALCLTPVVLGCTYDDADNFNPLATVDNGSCTFSGDASCPGDINFDGAVGTNDLLLFLASFGTSCD